MKDPVYIVISGISDYFDLHVKDDELAISVFNTFQRLIKESYSMYEPDVLLFEDGIAFAQFSDLKNCIEAILLLQRKLQGLSVLTTTSIIHSVEKRKILKWREQKRKAISKALIELAVENSVIVTSPVHEELLKLETYDSEFVENYEVEELKEVVSIYALTDDYLIIPEPEAIHAKVSDRSPKKTKKKASITHIIVAMSTLIGISAVFAYLNVLSSDPIISDYSIAVLPFKDKNTEIDSTEIKMSYGISDAIIDHLVKLEDLKVISHYSSRNVSSFTKNLTEVSNLLGVAYILQGDVIYDDNMVTINAKVIDAVSKETIWEKAYFREMEELLVVESEIAKEIVDLLKIKLSFDDMRAVVGLPTDNMDAYENYVLGQQENLKRNLQANRKSIDYFSRAIRQDTTFANAYAEIAVSTLNKIQYNDATPREVIRLANLYLDKAEDLNDQIATIYSSRGAINLYEKNYPEAQFNYEKAVRMAPNDPNILLGYARYFRALNEHEDEIEQIRKAYKLDPLSFDTAQKFAQAMMSNNNYNEVEVLLEDLRSKFGNHYGKEIQGLRVQYYLESEDFDQAIEQLKPIVSKDSLHWGALGYSYARKNDTIRAERVIDSLKSYRRYPMKNYEIATVFAGLNNRDSVMFYLDSTRTNPTVFLSRGIEYPQILNDKQLFKKLILNYYK